MIVRLLAAFCRLLFRIIHPAPQRFRQAGHLFAGPWVAVRVAIAGAVAYALHERRDGVSQVQRDGLARSLRGILERLGQSDQARDVCRRSRLHHRLRVGQPYVFGGEDAEAARYEDGVGSAFNEAGQPVERGVHV
jgi:hypothetical protein